MLITRTPVKPLEAIAHDHHTKGLYLTTAGLELYEQSPDTIEAFLDAGREMSGINNPPPGKYEYIAGGLTSHIYGMPGEAQLCIKAFNPARMKAGWKDSVDPGLPNLPVEVRYMDALQRHLATRSGTGVAAPTQYGLALFTAGGAANLQERIPKNFETIRRLRKILPELNTSEDEQGEIAFNKTLAALGGCFLRYGAGDMRGNYNVVNTGNYLIDPAQLAAEGPLYVIDLVGVSRRRQMMARLGARLVRG